MVAPQQSPGHARQVDRCADLFDGRRQLPGSTAPSRAWLPTSEHRALQPEQPLSCLLHGACGRRPAAAQRRGGPEWAVVRRRRGG